MHDIEIFVPQCTSLLITFMFTFVCVLH